MQEAQKNALTAKAKLEKLKKKIAMYKEENK